MGFTYDAGLRIRPPEPMPAENNSGDSAPTPFNLGQIQADIARNTEDITGLETDVSQLQTDVSSIQNNLASGVVQYANGATTFTAAFPDDGAWRVFVTPIGQALTGLYVTVSSSSFVATFSAAGAAVSAQWLAIKVS